MATRKGAGVGTRQRTGFIERHIYLVFVVSFLAAASAVFLANPFFVQALRFIVFDGFQRLSPAPESQDLPVRIVDIDDASLTRIGQWPWPRSKMAELVDDLRAKGAAVVVFDVMFSEPDRTSLEQIIRWLPGERAAQIGNVASQWVPYDMEFAHALRLMPSVLAATLTPKSSDSVTFPRKAGFAIAGDNPLPFLNSYDGVVGNLPVLTDVASGVGSINWIPDRDQVVRRVPLIFRVGDAIVPSIAAEALRVAQQASTYVIKSSNASGETAFGQASGVNHIKIGNIEIPTDRDGSIWIKYRRSDPEAFIPAWKVFSGGLSDDDVRGKIILIGTSAAGLLDLRATPLDSAVPGVEIHEQILEHILSGRHLMRPDFAPATELAALLAVGALLALIFPNVSAITAALLGITTIFGFGAATWWAYATKGMLFDPLYPSICIVLLEVFSTFYLYRRTERGRAEVRRAFQQYVSPAVVEQLIANPDRLILGGEVRELTIMFCDVRNFTKISEGLTAEQLTRFVNELLTPLSDIIMERRGTIDKYMGDAIMAFWNAPLDDPKHAHHACQAAEHMVKKMAALNDKWRADAKKTGRPFKDVVIGIGINTGEACVGNLGSSNRFDYSCIGDEVNVTSRFEGLTKLYGVPLVTSEETVNRLMIQDALEVDLVRVKGRDKPSRIFTLLSVLAAGPIDSERLKTNHQRMIALYRDQKWDEAEAALSECRALGVAALVPLYDLYAKRISAYKASPPIDWDGVYQAEEK